MKERGVIEAENPLIKTLRFDESLKLEAAVRTDVRHAHIREEKKGRAQDAGVGRQQKGRGKSIGKFFLSAQGDKANTTRDQPAVPSECLHLTTP